MSVDLSLEDLGLPERTVSAIDAEHARRIGATLDSDRVVGVGSPLPSLWHWAYFTPTAPTSGLGGDGHPRLASSRLADFPRRMWGAGTLEWFGDFVVGEEAERITAIMSTKATSGASGALLIVRLEHRYVQGGRDVAVEQQSLVYRSQGDPVPMPSDGPAPEPGESVSQREGRPEEPLLFRFSAITFNAHRIHYDLPYATAVEGYPGLVVHGPLTSLQLAQHVETSVGARLSRWQFKATAPMFAGRRQWFQCDPPSAEGTGEARVIRNDGATAMVASYTVRDVHG